MRADLVVRVLAQEDPLDVDAREPRLVLLQVEDRRAAPTSVLSVTGLNGSSRDVGADLAPDRAGRMPERAAQAARTRARARRVGRQALRHAPGPRAPCGCRPARVPLRSTIWPRGASTLTSRTRLSLASARYLSPDSTCRYQRRKKMIANSTSAIPPRIATRSASCGVTTMRLSPLGRYISDQASSARSVRVDRARRRGRRSSIRSGAQERAARPRTPAVASKRVHERADERSRGSRAGSRSSRPRAGTARARSRRRSRASASSPPIGGHELVRGVAQLAVAAGEVARRRSAAAT